MPAVVRLNKCVKRRLRSAPVEEDHHFIVMAAGKPHSWVMRYGCLLLAVALVAGCQKPATETPARGEDPGWPTQAQPRLPTVKLFVGTNELDTEIARTARQMATGMMFRKTMADTEGMIFVFPVPQRASFYMRNTTVPLSCAYIDTQGVIREIHDMKPFDETPIPSKSDQIRFCLEVPQGWFQRHNVPAGTGVSSAKGPLDKTLLNNR